LDSLKIYEKHKQFMKAIIKIIQGNKELYSFEFKEEINEILIGRHPNCNIIVNHQSVSREHAKLKRDWNGISIYDLSSKNGTFINNVKIRDHQLLKNGDVIRLGQSKIPEPILLIFEIQPLKIESDKHKEEKIQKEFPILENQKTPFYLKLPYIMIFFISLAIAIVGYLFFFSSLSEKPEIISISPSLAIPSKEMEIKGLNLKGKKVKPKVIIDNNNAEIISITSEVIKIKIPELPYLEGGIAKLPLKIKVGSKTSQTAFINIKISPKINSLSSSIVHPGDKITIFGSNFSKSKDRLKIWLNDEIIDPFEVKISSITFKVPAMENIEKKQANLIVEANGVKSNNFNITIFPSKGDTEILALETEKQFKNNIKVINVKSSLGIIFSVSNKASYSNIEERANKIIGMLKKYFQLAEENYDISFIVKNEEAYSIIKGKAMPIEGEGIIEEEIISINNEDAKYYSSFLDKELNNTEIAYWLSYTLNDVVNTFIMKNFPFYTSRISLGGKSLAKIWALFFKNKKSNEIPKNFMEYLSEKEKEYLSNLFLEFPQDKPNISGKWIGEGKDIIIKAPNAYLKFRMDIKEDNNEIAGVIFISVEGKIDEKNSFYHNLGKYNLKCHLKNTIEKDFEFVINVAKYGEMNFRGKLEGSKLIGYYLLKEKKESAFWKASYSGD